MKKGLTRIELINGYINHKITKWDKKHPKPCDDDDLFVNEFLVSWKIERTEKLNKITEEVNLKYSTVNINMLIKNKDTVSICKPHCKIRFERNMFNCNVPLHKRIKSKLNNISHNSNYEGKLSCFHLLDDNDVIKRVVLSELFAA